MKNKSNVMARKDVVNAISRFRFDMEDCVDGASLINMNIGVGYVLYDLVTFLDLTPEERIHALGLDIIDQIENMPIDIEIVDDHRDIGGFIDWSEMNGDQKLTLGKN